ncbi:hypothetical protein [Rhizobium sp. C4]|uniref:hypothetical protein n=1 Tax=Rhizobium sp. C4 TaxID=1349800 RepID=UPI001E427C81|nr:hypothetical protein [Rhizobium sp. C4]MCD2171677.1 hypothetical protein [Rhizobium sp. C4]
MRAFLKLSAAVVLSAAALSSCQSQKAAQAPTTVRSAALPVMERITTGANACWFRTKDPAFARYRMAPELNSFSGKPRLLLVAKHSPESRPLLVIMAEGDPARLQAFGPLMQGELHAKISAGVNHWARGNAGCPG